MKSDKILESLKQKDDKKRISLFVSDAVYAKFKKKCSAKNVPYSQVVEKLMQDFIDN